MAMMEEDEMDSLFEGMVLFTPSDQALEKQVVDDDDDVGNQLQLQDDGAPSITTTATTITTSTASSSSSLSNPLDGNLFSDLTLQTLNHTQLESDPPTVIATPIASSTTTRQNSTRKKKRAAGLRIGYGRGDSDDLNNDNNHPSPPTATSNHDPPPPPPPPPPPSASLVSQPQSPFDHVPSSDSDTNRLQAISNDQIPSTLSHSHYQFDFDLIKSQISLKLSRTRQLAASLSSSRKESIRTRRNALHQLNLASSNHKHLELQLQEACEAEDFDTAQKISDRLAAAEEAIQALLAALRDAEAHCDAIDSKMHDCLDLKISAEQECAFLLHCFAKDAESNADLVFKEVQALSSKEMDEWFSSSESLEANKIELDIQSHFINEAHVQLENFIEHSIEDDVKEREILCKKKDILLDELQKLLSLVKQKEKEIAENDTNIQLVDQRIADVVSTFQEIQSSIDAKQHHLQTSLSKIQLQNEVLSAKKKEIEKFLSEEEDHGDKLRELARISEDEAKAYQEVVELRKSLKLSILKSREDKVRLAKTEEKLTQDVQILQQEVSTARASLQELSSKKSSIQQNISSSKQKMFFIDKRVPELEAEKKVAAAARNFKEAARIASESKSLTLEKDVAQTDLEKATSELEKLEEDVKDTVKRLQDTEGLILSKEKEVAKARCQRLLLIASAATAERFAALELGDNEEASLLLAEAEAAKAEAEKLKPICNLKEEEFADLPKHLISVELVSNLSRNQLVELAASMDFSSKLSGPGGNRIEDDQS